MRTHRPNESRDLVNRPADPVATSAPPPPGPAAKPVKTKTPKPKKATP